MRSLLKATTLLGLAALVVPAAPVPSHAQFCDWRAPSCRAFARRNAENNRRREIRAERLNRLDDIRRAQIRRDGMPVKPY